MLIYCLIVFYCIYWFSFDQYQCYVVVVVGFVFQCCVFVEVEDVEVVGYVDQGIVDLFGVVVEVMVDFVVGGFVQGIGFVLLLCVMVEGNEVLVVFFVDVEVGGFVCVCGEVVL